MEQKDKTGRYLFVKAFAKEPEEWGYQPPGYAVIDLESSLGNIEHYCGAGRESQGKFGSALKCMIFEDGSPKFYSEHGDYFGSCDFYSQLEKAKSAVSRNLPSFISDRDSECFVSPILTAAQAHLYVATGGSANFSWEVCVADDNLGIFTAELSLEEIRKAPVFEGIADLCFDDNAGPSL